MLSIEIRKRLVSGYERTHDAKMIAQAYGVSEREVYKLAAQMRETGSVEPPPDKCSESVAPQRSLSGPSAVVEEIILL